MPLPKLSQNIMEVTAMSMAENPIKYLTDGLDEISAEDETLSIFLYRASQHKDMTLTEREAFLRGSLAVYLLLRNQAQADELDKQWS